MSVPCVPQRVFNTWHHLADGTLPPDLWSDAAELAAMVYLVAHHPVQAAFERLQTAVRDYNRVNRKLRLPQLSFDAMRSKQTLTAVARYVSSLPRSMHVGAIYAELSRGSSNRDWFEAKTRAIQAVPQSRFEKRSYG